MDNLTLNTTTPLITYPYHFHLTVHLLYTLIFTLATLFNSLLVYILLFIPKFHTVTNALIANLCLGDLLLTLFCLPFGYISILWQHWPFGRVLCHIVFPAQAVFVFVSAYTLVALAVDRYRAILYPLRPRWTKREAVLIISAVWMVALLTALPVGVFTRLEYDEESRMEYCEESGWPSAPLKMTYSMTLVTLQYFFPISVLIFTYTRIIFEVWKVDLTLTSMEERELRIARARRKTIVTSVVVVVGYTLAWLPLNLLMIYMETLTGDEEERSTPLEYLWFGCHFLAMAHAGYNPVVYGFCNGRFREAVVGVVRCRKADQSGQR